MMRPVDPTDRRGAAAVEIEVFRHLFSAVAEEMGAVLRMTASSPNIKERQDYSCALFSPDGVTVAMGDHMPVHLGALPMSVSAALAALGPLSPGDVAFLNDPYEGGTHLPDITMVAPVQGRDGGPLLGFVAARAHHADVGGMSPGSMPIAREIYQEGIRIPPVLIQRGGRRVPEVWRILLANVRTPSEREGDLDAQLGALRVGIGRMLELEERKGSQRLLDAQSELISYGERLVQEGVLRIPDGRWQAEDTLESDGFSEEPIPIRVELSVSEGRIRFDFSGSAPQTEGCVNAVAAVTTSASRYVLRCVVEALLECELPAGGGTMDVLDLVLPERSVVNAAPPAAVAAGNVETSQRITDVLLRAFDRALPGRIPGLSQGTMNNVTVGGTDNGSGRPFAYYETVGGGMGGGPGGPGLSGVHTHMSNTLNTPVEALEHAYPFRVLRYSLREGSGGSGLHPGGQGLRRDLQMLVPAEVTLLCERRRAGPSGHAGGYAGSNGENVLIRDSVETFLPGKTTFRAEPGDVISIRSPGGGGWGRLDSIDSGND
jgi:N-methylhydantoinase B